MNGVTVSSKDYHGAIDNNGIWELEIVVSGTNRLKATERDALRCDYSTTISGGGTLSAVSGNGDAVYTRETLTISGTTLEASGKYGISGAHGTGNETLILKNAKVTAKGTEGAIIKLANFVTEGCEIIYPVGGKFDKEKHAVVDADGNIANEVRIAPIKNYDLTIAGVHVTHANCDDLSKIDGVSVAEGGEFKYDPDTNTLTMKDVTVSVGNNKNAIENKGVEGLEIKISGTNRLESTNYSSLYCGVTTNIGGEGTLTTVGSKNANGVGTYVKTTLTISDITLEASGKWGIAGQDGNQNEILILKNAKVIAEGSVAGIADLASLTLEGCKMVAPVDGKFDKEQHAVVDAQGNKAKEVKIEPFVKYQLNIAGTQVTELNYNVLKDIDGVSVAEGGEFKYDPNSNTLTMKDVTVLADGYKIAISTSVADLKIIVSGANRLESKGWGTFISGASTFIEGDGSLTVINSSSSSILVAESTLTISDITVEASGKMYGIVGFSGKGEHLVLNNTKLIAKGDDYAAIRFFESLTLDGCKIIAPVGGKYDVAERAVVDAEGKNAKEVKIEKADPVAVTGVRVMPTTVNLKVSETQQLTISVEPATATNKRYTCQSNNESVATVDKLGFIKAVGAGTAVITITTVDGNKKAQCTVNVEKNGGSTPPAAVTGVTLAYSDLTLKIGTSLRLVAKIEPANATNKAVTWSSDNDAVATVSDAGLVEAKTVGKATIKVTTQDGGYIATCSFTVTAEDVVLTGLKVSSAELHIEVGQTSNLYVNYEPAGATHREVTWETSDAAIVTVDANGSLQGVAVGEATVTVTSKMNPSIKATCKVIVKPATAVEDVVFAKVVVAPNPFNNELRIANGELRGTYTLLNVQGVVVRSGNIVANEVVIETTDLTSGLYLLRLTAENGVVKTYRVVKQ